MRWRSRRRSGIARFLNSTASRSRWPPTGRTTRSKVKNVGKAIQDALRAIER